MVNAVITVNAVIMAPAHKFLSQLPGEGLEQQRLFHAAEGEADLHFLCVGFRLGHAFRHRQLEIALGQPVVGDLRNAAPAAPPRCGPG